MPASAISATGAATFALLTEATNAAAQRVADLNLRTAPANYKAQLGTYLKELAVSVAALDAAYTSQLGTPPNWGAGVADIAALKLVAEASRADKQTRVVESNGKGGESIYIFDAESTLDAEDINVIVPTAGTGRWILASQGGVRTIPVTAGEGISKANACYVSGWDATNKRLIVRKADSTNPGRQAIGVAPAAILNGAQGYLAVGEVSISTSGLNTVGAGVGTEIFYSSAGALTLTRPLQYVQSVARVVTEAASGTVRVALTPTLAATPKQIVAVGTPGAEVANAINVAIQFKHLFGDNVAEVVSFKAMALDSKYAQSPSANLDITIGAAGSINDGSGSGGVHASSTAAGLCNLVVTDSSTVLAGTAYLSIQASGRDANGTNVFAEVLVPLVFA